MDRISCECSLKVECVTQGSKRVVVRVPVSENKCDDRRTGLACIKLYNFVGSTYTGLGTVFLSMNEKSIMRYLLGLFVDVVPFQNDQWRVTMPVEVKCAFLLAFIGSIAEFGTSRKIISGNDSSGSLEWFLPMIVAIRQADRWTLDHVLRLD